MTTPTIADRWTVTSRAEASAILGVSTSMLQTHSKRGMPGDRGRWPIPQMIAWLRENVWAAAAVADDELLADGDGSPALERYRLARAQQEEIKLQTMRSDYVSIDDIRTLLMETAALYRGATERLIREFGNDAGDIIATAIDEADHRWSQRWSGDTPDAN